MEELKEKISIKGLMTVFKMKLFLFLNIIFIITISANEKVIIDRGDFSKGKQYQLLKQNILYAILVNDKEYCIVKQENISKSEFIYSKKTYVKIVDEFKPNIIYNIGMEVHEDGTSVMLFIKAKDQSPMEKPKNVNHKPKMKIDDYFHKRPVNKTDESISIKN